MVDKNIVKPGEPPGPGLAPKEGAKVRNATAADGDYHSSIAPDREYFHGFVKETTAWDIYNNEAKKVDREVVKDWTASLNFLLVFVSAFILIL
jgi:hypothetical protein